MKGFSLGLLMRASALTCMTTACSSDMAIPRQVGQAVNESPAHHTANGFRNLYEEANPHKGLWPYLRMKYIEETFPVPTEATKPATVTSDLAQIARPAEALQVTWIGHASTLIQSAGVNILTDPVFSKRASPFSFSGPQRYTDPGLSLEDLPTIHFVVISHNHYDHLDRAVVSALGNRVQWIVPLGLKAWFAAAGVTRVTELDWWQSASIDGVEFTATPAQHWSRRGLADTNKTLWASFCIVHGDHRIWFAGDTGYAQPLFEEIGQRFGPFDLALIPIGGYGPRWFMRAKHADPDEAVKIHRDIRARKSVAIHWGAFVMTSEPIEEPPQLLQHAKAEHRLANDAMVTLAIGETLAVKTDGGKH